MSIINNWQSLIKPSKLKLDVDEDAIYKATLTAEPLERRKVIMEEKAFRGFSFHLVDSLGVI